MVRTLPQDPALLSACLRALRAGIVPWWLPTRAH